ncbi:pantothenate synthetase [Coriobacterium glomerans PW2]|uniref:Pantothenate synthetase n=1 Tax=Coriobacterium glomerans (strain ATCC 49209 / DSM 20642 / JCM 10262 / PW2) TaxID=700015 RepID=F2N7R7_CORGP|nr:pantoate--beta-alanine ligase [Coriobacterium glomerans]AEB06959.1 pantothenate synthetase [Coriobacterium glomerans PW2]
MIEIVRTVAEMRARRAAWRRQGLSVGLVPTMGYLHEGHASLIETAAATDDRVIVSVYVNERQFGPGEDLERYPRDIERDLAVCERAGADILFNPESAEMYAADHSTTVHMAGITDELCGRSRPGHFDGVCLVVSKLFNIAEPDRAYFGQKDAQQLLVIRRMVRDLNFNIELIGCPTVREPDGLAKSSRNAYLSDDERSAAPILHRALACGLTLCEQGCRDASRVRRAVSDALAEEPLAQVEYVEVVSTDSVQPVERIDAEVLCAIAVRIGGTRLIDNFMFDPER